MKKKKGETEKKEEKYGSGIWCEARTQRRPAKTTSHDRQEQISQKQNNNNKTKQKRQTRSRDKTRTRARTTTRTRSKAKDKDKENDNGKGQKDPPRPKKDTDGYLNIQFISTTEHRPHRAFQTLALRPSYPRIPTGLASTTTTTMSLDYYHHHEYTTSPPYTHHKAQELIESRGGRPRIPVPDKPCGFGGRKAP